MRMKIVAIIVFTLVFLPVSNSQTVGDYNLLIADGGFSPNALSELTAMGHTVYVENPTNLVPGYDYSPYDAIIFMFNAALPPGMNDILTLNQNCQLGIILMRGENVISQCDMGTSVTWSTTNFAIDDNSHYITQPFMTGLLDLGFDYKSNVTAVNPGNTVLGSVAGGNGSLVVHDTYKRVISPYYGHGTGMPWNPAAEVLMDRIIAWAVAPCCTANTGTDVQTSCDNYTWIDGNTYSTSNNTATYTLTNVDGCDSVVSLDLTINNSNSGTDIITACNSFTWIDGITYTSNNNSATYTLTNSAGCDSVITLDLQIASLSVSDLIITQNSNELTVAASNADQYQWIDCASNNSVAGETSQTYQPTIDGTYAVEVVNGSCVDTSACFTFSTSSISVDPREAIIELYPNPAKHHTILEVLPKYVGEHYYIYDLSGRIVCQGMITGQLNKIDLNLARGTYVISIDRYVRRFLIQ